MVFGERYRTVSRDPGHGHSRQLGQQGNAVSPGVGRGGDPASGRPPISEAAFPEVFPRITYLHHAQVLFRDLFFVTGSLLSHAAERLCPKLHVCVIALL